MKRIGNCGQQVSCVVALFLMLALWESWRAQAVYAALQGQ